MTTTKELFAIASYDSKFADYYLDVQGNLWSVKTGKPKRIKTNRFGLNGYKVHIDNMIRDIRNHPSHIWQWTVNLQMFECRNAERTLQERSQDAIQRP